MLGKQDISWFHCGRCGSLFQSPTRASHQRLCTACGRSPWPEDGTLQRIKKTTQPQVPAPARGSVRKEKKKLKYRYLNGWVIFCVVSTLAVLLVLLMALRMQNFQNERSFSSVKKEAVSTVAAEDAAFLNQFAPLCHQTLSGFLSAVTPEERSQFVMSPVSEVARIANFYQLNAPPSIDPRALKIDQIAVLRLPGGPAIETSWKTTDGLWLNTVFVQEDDEWRLDWNHYARYCDYPWPMFLAGGGQREGEFRLLARERLAEERKGADTISLVFSAPQLGKPGETSLKSPEFLVPRNSKSGRLLTAASQRAKVGKLAFDVDLKTIYPEGLIPVRVKLRRIDDADGRRFELVDLVACHWYSVDASGFEVAEPRLEN